MSRIHYSLDKVLASSVTREKTTERNAGSTPLGASASCRRFFLHGETRRQGCRRSQAHRRRWSRKVPIILMNDPSKRSEKKVPKDFLTPSYIPASRETSRVMTGAS